MHVALRLPDAFGAADLTLEQMLSMSARLGVAAIELDASTIETILGKPAVSPRWLEMPDNAFEAGALPLEEEIMRDEIALAQQTIDNAVREWRTSVALAPLDGLRQHAQDLGVRMASVRWSGLARLSEAEVDWCFTVTKALGANAIVTPLVVGDPRRLAPFADRHAVTVAFRGDRRTRHTDFTAALRHSSFNAVSLDLRAWGSGNHGSPLSFLRHDAGRVMQICIDAADVADEPLAGLVSAVLAETRVNDWNPQLAIGLDDEAIQGADRTATLARTIDYCLNGLRLKT